MKTTLALSTLALLVALEPQILAESLADSAEPRAMATQEAAGGQQAAKGPQWKSNDEYQAFQKMATEQDPRKRSNLADDFLQKYSNSDFKDQAYVAKMQSYQQLNDPAHAIDAAHKALDANPDNIAALNYVSFAFPFTFKGDDPDKDAKLSKAEGYAKHGLDVVQKLQKPANIPEDQFSQQVKILRANFNDAIGFVALQRKDYAPAITSFKAAEQDNPTDLYVAYRLGIAYLTSAPPDYDNAFWQIARAVSLGKAAKAPDEPGIEKYLKSAYSNYHGNDEGLDTILAQAAASPTPPAGFKVAPLEKPKATGNKMLDAFNDMVFPLKLGGDRAQKAWDTVKGQDVGLAGFVNSVEKGSDPGLYLVRISMDQAKASSGYDIELKDSTQAGVTDLKQGDPVRFSGKIAAYTATPTFVLVVDNAKINDEDLAAAAANKPQKKTPARPKPRTRKAAG
jgi:tetratricopeptide (TPR) repeat protein